MYLDRKQIDNMVYFVEKVHAIESDTKCEIKLHDIQSEIVWIRVKHTDNEPRDMACARINELTNQQCKVVLLPKIPEKTLASIRENNRLMTSATNIKQQQRPRVTAITRSSTENNIASSDNASPFSSFLAPLSLNESIQENDADDENEDLESVLVEADKSSPPASEAFTNDSKPKRQIKVIYTTDFLLKRADAPTSKILPPNWEELNQKYPSVCFCGKVSFNLSYWFENENA